MGKWLDPNFDKKMHTHRPTAERDGRGLRSLLSQCSTVLTTFRLNDFWTTVFRRSEISTIKRKPFAVIFCGNKPTERRVGSQGYRHPAL